MIIIPAATILYLILVLATPLNFDAVWLVIALILDLVSELVP